VEREAVAQRLEPSKYLTLRFTPSSGMPYRLSEIAPPPPPDAPPSTVMWFGRTHPSHIQIGRPLPRQNREQRALYNS